MKGNKKWKKKNRRQRLVVVLGSIDFDRTIDQNSLLIKTNDLGRKSGVVYLYNSNFFLIYLIAVENYLLAFIYLYTHSLI